VVELLADDQARVEMGERARRIAMELFGWGRAAERTIEILQGVARPR
jgi:glycosyltransferase involved in cell wall biosynthesis